MEIYDDIKLVLGTGTFVPNFFKAQAHNPEHLQVVWGLVNTILCNGVLPRLLKEMIFVRVAEAKGCTYCMTAHLAFCAKLGVSARNCQQLFDEAPKLLRADFVTLLQYASDVSSVPSCATLQSIEGLTREEFDEACQMIALSAYASYLADSLQIPVDDEFKLILGTTT